METLIDSSVWIEFFHPKTPRLVRQIARDYIASAGAVICEPVYAEIFHGMPDRHAEKVAEHLATVPMLSTPLTLWQDVIPMIRACTKKGNPIGTLDALIAVIALKHGATIITFDKNFLPLQENCGVAVEILNRIG